MITCLLYRNQQCISLTYEQLVNEDWNSLFHGSKVWIDLQNPTLEEEEYIFETLFAFHPLAIEDCQKKPNSEAGYHYPKVEEYSNYLFVIVNPLDPTSFIKLENAKSGSSNIFEFPTLQLNAFLGDSFLITHHYTGLPAIDVCKNHIEKFPKVMERGPDYIYQTIVDSMVDDFNPVLEFFDDEIDELEELLFEKYDPNLLSRIFNLKKGIVKLRKISTYQKEVLSRLSRGEFGLISDHERMYYRNVYDHLVRVTDLTESYRDTVTGMLDVYISVNSNRMNQVMKVLTVIATIFLPLTFLSSIYGMNFHYMPELLLPYGYFAFWGLLISLTVFMLLYFRKKGWLE